MKLVPHPANQNLTIFPASLLNDERWQTILASRQSTSGYILVSAISNPKQTKLVLRLSHDLQQRGKRVSILSL